MAKKSPQRGKQIRMSAEFIWNKPLTERQKASLENVAKRQRSANVSQIDYSDIPALTDKQLAQFRRP
jgi:hypothetical protein